MNADELRGYVAGIIDGEGSIMVKKEKRPPGIYYQLVLQVCNTHHGLLEFLQQHYRGNIRAAHPDSPKRARTYIWRLSGAPAQTLLGEIMPLLIIKRPQAQLISRLPRVGTGHRFNYDQRKLLEKVAGQIRLLNKRGPRNEQLLMELETEGQLTLALKKEPSAEGVV